ncbi:MAG: nucleoside deaminase [Rubripirellula sp.]|nr:nucleoside deaminase [Rubripirellula sp.]
MALPTDEQNAERMRLLVDFTSQSLGSDHPSPFGSSIYDVTTEEVLAEAFDTVMRDCDPTSHAEVNVIRKATKKSQRLSLRGCVLYSTCEPCPMCMSACIWAELDAVVYGAATMEDANRYWPQSSDMTPQELIDRVRPGLSCTLVPHVERSLCQQLFLRCDEVRTKRLLQLPPNRGESLI